MPARDSSILWRLRGPASEIVCYVVDGDEGLAVTVEHRGEIVLAEMTPGLDAALIRAEAVRRTFIEQGFQEVDFR